MLFSSKIRNLYMCKVTRLPVRELLTGYKMTNTTQKTADETDIRTLNGKTIDINLLSEGEQEIVRRFDGDSEGALSDYDLEEAFGEMLDECYPETEIGYSVFYAGEILKECDPIQFSIGAEEYNDAQAEDIIYEAEEVEQ